MEIFFWVCTIIVVCIIAGVMFYKPYLGIVFIIISIPFEGSVISNGISIYPLEVILIILVFTCIFKHIVGTENYSRNTKLVFYYLPFMLFLLLSALKFMEFSLMVKEIVRWLELILVYFLTINLINGDKKVRVVLYSMILTAVMVSICGIVSYLSGVADVYEGRPGAYVFFGHPNALAGYINLIIPVIFGLLFTSVFLWERIMLGVFSVLTILVWFLTYSRAAWLSLILVMILSPFLTKVKKRTAFLLIMIFAIFAIIFLFSISNVTNDIMERLLTTNATLESRFQCYLIGFRMVRDNLFFGIGIGNYLLLSGKIPTSLAIQENHLHNLYLQIFVEAGIMGLCTFFFWLAYVLKYLMSTLKSLRNSRNYGIFVGLVGGVMVYLFSNFADVLTVHGIHIQWGIILGLAVALSQFRGSEKCLKAV